MLSSGDEPTFLLPGLSFVINEFTDGAVSHAGRGVAFHHLAVGILQTVFFYHFLGFRIRRKPNDITDFVLITRVDDLVGVKAAVSSEQKLVIGKSNRQSHKQTFNMVLKLSARICCTAGIEHRQRPAVEKAHNRSKAIALVMGVVRLSFLITVKINMRGVDINDQYRSLPGPGPGKDALLSVGPKQCIQKTAVEAIKIVSGY